MNVRYGSLAGVVLLATAACVGPAVDLGSLRPGLWVQASGSPEDPEFSIRKVETEPRTDSDKREKVEVTAPVGAVTGDELRAVDHRFLIDADTEYEDQNKEQAARFVPAPGEWVRLKLRAKDEAHRVRTLRRYDPSDRFKVIGELYGVDLDERLVEIGGLRLPLAPDVELDLTAPDSAQDPLALFFGDDQKTVPLSIAISDDLRLGGQVAGEYEWNDEFDLDPTRDRDRTKYSTGGRLDMLWGLDDRGSYVLAEASFGRRDRLRQNGADTVSETLEITRAFASFQLGDHLQVLAGRQDFDEGREWVYDEVLDGLRGVVTVDRLRFDVGYAEGRDVLAEDNVEQDWGMWLGKLSYAVADDWNVSGYALQRLDQTPSDFEPWFLGVQSQAEPRFGFGHWLEFALARGDAAGRDVRGHGFDVGISYTFDSAWRPCVAIGHAFGSGRATSDAKLGFRQTGFQDNTGKLGGVTSVRFYGELVDPELANLSVTTLSFAMRPIRRGSIQLMLHGYRQDVASTQLIDTSLRANPAGVRRDLGAELDLVLAYRIARRLTIEFVAGRFESGDAFQREASANLIVLTTRYSF